MRIISAIINLVPIYVLIIRENIPYIPVNNYLSIKLNERNFGFIDNTNINITNNLNKIGLHLNYSGTKLLADNFLDIINL